MKKKSKFADLIKHMQKTNSWYISNQDNNIKKKAVQLSFPKNWLFCILCACAQPLSRVWLCVTPWTVVHQAPLSVGFSRQEYCSGLPCPPSGDLPDPGIEPTSLVSPALAGGFFTTSATGEAHFIFYKVAFLLHPRQYKAVSCTWQEEEEKMLSPVTEKVLTHQEGLFELGLSQILNKSCPGEDWGSGDWSTREAQGQQSQFSPLWPRH